MSDFTAHEQSMSGSTAVQVVAARPRKVVTVRGRGKAALNKVPDDILNDPELKLAMEVLPDNYNLEIPKVITDQSHENTNNSVLQTIWIMMIMMMMTIIMIMMIITLFYRPFGGYEETASGGLLFRCPRDSHCSQRQSVTSLRK